MKKKLLVTIGLLPLFMSACAVQKLHDENHNTRREQGILLQDQLIAVGVPAKPIKGYEDALAIAGNQYSYLVKPSTMLDRHPIRTPIGLTKILNEVDLNYLAVGQRKYVSGQNEDEYKDVFSPKFEILIKDSTKAMNHTINSSEIVFMYNKPQSLIKSGEINHLESLGFTCKAVGSSLCCSNLGYVDITIAKPISNKNQLKHVLKNPLELNISYDVYKANPNIVAKKIALTPLAIVFDIVTSPIQLVGMGLEALIF